MTEFRLAIGAIFKDEAEYLAEWLTFHQVVGVEHFFLYNNESSDDPESILAPFIRSGSVTLIDFPGEAAQMPAYNDCVARADGRAAWLALIDVDEFLFPTSPASLPDILGRFDDAPAVVVNWVSFGSSGHVARPQGLVIEEYTRRGTLDHPSRILLNPDMDPEDARSYRPLNTHVKSIVRPPFVTQVPNPHYAEYKVGAAVNERREPIIGPWTDDVSVDVLRINHYWSKSQEDMRAKHERGRADTGRARAWEEFELRDSLCNAETDEVILRYVPEVKARLASSGARNDASVHP